MQIMIWSETQLAYLAGIIDGEGTFYIGKINPRKFTSRIYVVNTDKRLIDWLHQNFNGSCYTRNSIKNPHWKTRYEWVLDKAQIDSVCKKILPFLIVKKQHAEAMIKFRQTFIHHKRPRISDEILNFRNNCHEKMKKLNHRSLTV